jgi:hypothetical protein
MIRRWSIVFAAFTAAIFNVTPAAAADVGISVNVGQPGFYGRIDIGSFPRPPAVIYEQPVVVTPAPVTVIQRPIYLRVPPGHAKYWSRHCSRYNACGQQTYFVQDDWYQRVYVPARGHHHAAPHHHHHARRDHRDHRDHRGHHAHRGDRHEGNKRGHGRGRD